MNYTIEIDCSICGIEFMDDFILALSKVNRKYVLYPDPERKQNGKDKYKYPERVFAYEFYHQYRLIMEAKPIIYKDLYLNGEQPKSSNVWKGLAKMTPDIVLHGEIDKEDKTGDSQKWLCEIKMKGNPKLTDDLKKIKDKEHLLKFSNYIFLYVGATLQNLVDDVSKGNRGDMDEDTICVSAFYDQDGIKIACRRLKDLY